MSITAQSVVDDAELILMDSDNDHWTEAELFGYLKDGEKETAIHKPDIYIINDDVVLVEGTRQSLPSGAIHLIDIVRNMGTNGSTIGDVITLIDKKSFDAIDRSWHKATASATVEHFMFDSRDPTRFYVYPPQPSSSFGYVDMIYASIPPTISAISSNINLDDIYKHVLVNYLLYRAYSKDVDISADGGAKATFYYKMFLQGLGVKDQKEEADAPKR